ncbi:1-acyl-sn-glycerol-3-phosphate acyltransferase [Apostasia shenzhenica]|uniref:1-acyl-sn-glycerol-3-phosphate acyltransferase n=1 Tax=Apostasia shenzhenica TaxID=1088818 RepID=A0A2I0B7F4_9ASPA|nr:1-acyl-sn-glycerol-3-phosphate acyltransferase [Apostasia shenzhenica]
MSSTLVAYSRRFCSSPSSFSLASYFSHVVSRDWPTKMDSAGLSSLIRGRWLDSYFEAIFRSPEPCRTKKPAIAAGQRPLKHRRPPCSADGEVSFVDDDRWITVAISVIRIVSCFVTMLATTIMWTVVMLALLPWPYLRIRQSNLYGHVTGRLMMWILGNPIKIEGSEYANTRAIYICNHASPIDIFLVMWLTPTGTVGIAKKEIIWYPMFGQLYVLANHLRIDRSNPAAAIESIKKVDKLDPLLYVVALGVVRKNLSLIIFPEGTRSRTGRLLPFKKGFVHIALQSKLPIIPMVLTGTHVAWRKNSLRVRPAPLTVRYLPPIKTSDWVEKDINKYVQMVHDLYLQHLPESQKPLKSEGNDVSLKS